jgi:hypothetical protein
MRRRPGILVLAALGALILGFLAKRTFIPSAVHYIAYRPPEQPQPMREASPPADDSVAASAKSNAGAGGGSEQLTPGDRSALDAILKRKAK